MTIDGSPLLCCISAHLPHSGKSDDEYAAALEALDFIISKARSKKSIVLIGVDANAVIGQMLEHDDRRNIGRWGIGDRNVRGESFVAWLRMSRLAAANTRFQKSHDRLWTQQQWSTRAKRQIDYVLIENSDDLILLDADVDD